MYKNIKSKIIKDAVTFLNKNDLQEFIEDLIEKDTDYVLECWKTTIDLIRYEQEKGTIPDNIKESIESGVSKVMNDKQAVAEVFVVESLAKTVEHFIREEYSVYAYLTEFSTEGHSKIYIFKYPHLYDIIGGIEEQSNPVVKDWIKFKMLDFSEKSIDNILKI